MRGWRSWSGLGSGQCRAVSCSTTCSCSSPCMPRAIECPGPCRHSTVASAMPHSRRGLRNRAGSVPPSEVRVRPVGRHRGSVAPVTKSTPSANSERVANWRNRDERPARCSRTPPCRISGDRRKNACRRHRCALCHRCQRVIACTGETTGASDGQAGRLECPCNCRPRTGSTRNAARSTGDAGPTPPADRA